MLHKEATKWNLDSLTELIEGPLLNPKRFEEAMKVSRFGRKLMSFFHPNNKVFSEMKNTKARNSLWFIFVCHVQVFRTTPCPLLAFQSIS
jgi:rapamycin-insensitive companion of mTOR